MVAAFPNRHRGSFPPKYPQRQRSARGIGLSGFRSLFFCRKGAETLLVYVYVGIQNCTGKCQGVGTIRSADCCPGFEYLFLGRA